MSNLFAHDQLIKFSTFLSNYIIHVLIQIQIFWTGHVDKTHFKLEVNEGEMICKVLTKSRCCHANYSHTEIL